MAPDAEPVDAAVFLLQQVGDSVFLIRIPYPPGADEKVDDQAQNDAMRSAAAPLCFHLIATKHARGPAP
jgi:hypothetical protein